MSQLKLRLTKTQLDFICHMLEIPSTTDAVIKFAEMMTEGKLEPKNMSEVITRIHKKYQEKAETK